MAAWLTCKLISARGTHVHSSEPEYSLSGTEVGNHVIKLSRRLPCA